MIRNFYLLRGIISYDLSDTLLIMDLDPKPQHEIEAEKKIAELLKANGVLKANISTLYRTARAEIARKDERIRDLQSELDTLIFRRLNKKYELENAKILNETPKTMN